MTIRGQIAFRVNYRLWLTGNIKGLGKWALKLKTARQKSIEHLG